ncbi:MAG: energy transducer TonB [Polaromonas sp.]|nr:energy transducer TonB [Polaromonas sp.]MBK9341290.1 energy transducer TonB [Rhodoferax sp.]
MSSFIDKHRIALIASAVLMFHVFAIWALQTGLLMRAVEVVVPVEVLAQIMEPPKPMAPKSPPIDAPPPETVKKPVTKPEPVTQVAPTLLAVPDAVPTPNAPSIQPIAQPAPYAPAVPVAAVTTPALAKITLPSSDADYLSNPKPTYPAMSKRLGEQGKVVVRVLIGADGLPQKSELRQSSGFDRLDDAALATVMKWRYVPGKRDGIAEAMWFNVPITFRLE